MIALLFGALIMAGAQPATAIDFRSKIAPILEQNCVSCHQSSQDAKQIDLTSHDFVFSRKLIIPGQPDSSPLYVRIKNGTMPPTGKLSESDIETIAQWIREGANWPSDVAIKALPKAAAKPNSETSELENVRQIRARIAASHAHDAAQPYKVTIPNTTVAYDMVPVSGGHFSMGSSQKPDEQPAHTVTLNPFWMQAHEVTWDEYRLFMFAKQAGEVAMKDETVDAVSRPTRPYVEMSFGMGINGFPAISMTQHAANKYAEWLSAKTGEFYRLPTEAEWEYACRAGQPAIDSAQLKNYAWYSGNSAGKYQKVATKKPNSWGLYDMLGNVMEWTLDAYAPYQAAAQTNPWIKATSPYPFSVRGGSWNDPADQLTCTSRVASDPSWKQQDPQLPKSVWYETDAQWLGFRLIRPATLPSAEEMYKSWNNGVEHDEQ